ncbi:MAG: aryl-sulfate sulfotransferase [Methanococcaceae archaeon]
MKIKLLFLSIIFIVTSFAESNNKSTEILYIYPNPGSKFIHVNSTIFIKVDEKFQSQLKSSSMNFSVVGSKSGYHKGKIIISGNTVIFEPESVFETSETVDVSVSSPSLSPGELCTFSFETSSIKEYDPKVFQTFSDDNNFLALDKSIANTVGKVTSINGVTVPSDFPRMNVTLSNQPAPGKIFIANWGGTSYMMILENDGTPYFYKRFPGSNQTRDFKIQPTGTLTRRVYENLNCFVEMDSQFTTIDTLMCKNGYGTDEHELILSPDHHSFMIALDYRTVDMSKIVSGGQTSATVVGNSVQELDENHNVVFQWNCWNNFNIADAVHENLQSNSIDYIHMNSIAIDYDSNLVISSRHLSEVTKINRKTGKIMWRFGGVHNQFRLVNDTYGLSYQHNVRPVPGKPNQYTIYDNGNFHSPQFSRAVEFKIDTTNWTATKVWEYRHSPDYYSWFMGNVQRLPNGNSYIDWGDGPLPKAFEVNPTGQIVYEANFAAGTPCYRSYRFEWQSVSKVPYLVAESYSDKVTLIFNKFGDTNVEKYIIYAGISPHPVTPIDSTSATSINLTKLTNNQLYYFRVTARNAAGIESDYSNEESVQVKFTQPGQNLIRNGDFWLGSNFWTFNARNGAAAQGTVANEQFVVTITNAGTAYSDIQLTQESFPIINGKHYTFEFDARASGNRVMEPRIAQNGGNYTVYSKTGPIVLTTQMTHFKYPFVMTDPTDYSARVVMNCGTSNLTCYFDNISIKEDLTSAVEDGNSNIPEEFMLYQNYPNPFNPSTEINYALPELSFVTVEIYDILGRKIKSLINSMQEAGLHHINFDASNLTSGIYFYKLDARTLKNENFSKINKMLLLK